VRAFSWIERGRPAAAVPAPSREAEPYFTALL
jgi:hypothetical protein